MTKEKTTAPYGIVVVDKPEGFTSFDVVAKMRGICGTKQIGHGGTLDPMATGVLPVFVGRATKAVDMAPNQNKAYDALIRFGIQTDTGDITGEVTGQKNGIVAQKDIEAVLPQFTGTQSQLPPMYSAVKINGKPLYKYAREGKAAPPRKPREITVHRLELLQQQGENLFLVHAACSKGTYIRTLAEDIGKALNMPATLAGLRRTQAGVFSLNGAHTLAEIEAAKENGTLQSLFLPPDVLFDELPVFELNDETLARLVNGAKIYRTGMAEGRRRAYSGKDFAGLVAIDCEGTAKVEKLFWQGGGQ